MRPSRSALKPGAMVRAMTGGPPLLPTILFAGSGRPDLLAFLTAISPADLPWIIRSLYTDDLPVAPVTPTRLAPMTPALHRRGFLAAGAGGFAASLAAGPHLLGQEPRTPAP